MLLATTLCGDGATSGEGAEDDVRSARQPAGRSPSPGRRSRSPAAARSAGSARGCPGPAPAGPAAVRPGRGRCPEPGARRRRPTAPRRGSPRPGRRRPGPPGGSAGGRRGWPPGPASHRWPAGPPRPARRRRPAGCRRRSSRGCRGSARPARRRGRPLRRPARCRRRGPCPGAPGRGPPPPAHRPAWSPSGRGRTGPTLACELVGVAPGLVLLGKALGGGIVPVSAVVGRGDVLGVLTPGTHGSTFGGNPLACAVGLAVVDLLATGEMQARAATLGAHLQTRLAALADDGLAAATRGVGLWAGVDVHPAQGTGRDLAERLLARRVP